MSLRTLGMLDRAGLRKIATDCGFDVLEDGTDWVGAVSTQAPLRAWIGLTMGGASPWPVDVVGAVGAAGDLHGNPCRSGCASCRLDPAR